MTNMRGLIKGQRLLWREHPDWQSRHNTDHKVVHDRTMIWDSHSKTDRDS